MRPAEVVPEAGQPPSSPGAAPASELIYALSLSGPRHLPEAPTLILIASGFERSNATRAVQLVVDASLPAGCVKVMASGEEGGPFMASTISINITIITVDVPLLWGLGT